MIAWEALVEGAFEDPAGRITGISVVERPDATAVVTLRFTAEDFRGEPYEATAKVFLPAGLLDGSLEPAPVWFACGYELPEPLAEPHLELGRIVVTSGTPEPGEVFPHDSPLARGPNTDVVLAHLVRGFRLADPAAIVYTGGSAGGYAALLVAAEAFPAAAVAANVPVVNLQYQAAFFTYNCPRLAASPPPDLPLVGVLMAYFAQFIEEGWNRGYGTDLSEQHWYEHSPIAHLERITCRAVACFSTADFLVPIEQVGEELAAPTVRSTPAGMRIAARELSSQPTASLRLVDLLGDAADVQVVPVPAGAAESPIENLDVTMTRPELPFAVPAGASGGRQWLVTVVDEGPVVLGYGHTRHAIQPDFEPFAVRAIASGVAVDQLTAPKLDQLLDRWSGTEWLASGFHHLDRQPAERRDVERGLQLYCAASPEHRERFVALYDALPPSRRVLPGPLVDELAAGSSSGSDALGLSR